MLKQNIPAIFLDRDGVICSEKSYILNVDALEIKPFVKECVKYAKSLGYVCVVITNQSAVARGMLELSELQKMNEYIISETGVDDVFFCPHHPKGIIPKYSIECRCRKPQSGMIESAIEKYCIDIEKSYLVGDRDSDIMAGKNKGIKTILIKSTDEYFSKALQKKPDYIIDSLEELISII